MKYLVPVTFLAVSAALAQTPTVVNSRIGGPVIPNGTRFGNILYPGGLPSAHQQTFPSRLGANVGGRPIPGWNGVGGYGGYGGPGRPGRQGRNQTIVVPYAVPVYYDPGYYAAQQQPNITVVVPQQQTPSVVINHNYAPDTPRPIMRDYSDVELPKSGGLQVFEGPKSSASEAQPAEEKRAAAPGRTLASDTPNIYLIALKDSTVRQAIGWWTEGNTLHYVTPQSSINRITLDQVDYESSTKLNAERKLEFDLRIR